MDEFQKALDDDFEERLEMVEELSKVKILRSCEELARHGVAKNGAYTIDPDGEMISSDPIVVNCIFDSGNVITEIPHYQEKPIVIDHCDTLACFNQNIDYPVPLSQLEALVSLSENCEQFVSFGCFLAPLETEDQFLGGWNDRKGVCYLINIIFKYIVIFISNVF